MVGKNNYKTRAEKTANRKQRFSLKKLSVGVASVAVGTTLFLGNTDAVSAEEGEASVDSEYDFVSATGEGEDSVDSEYDFVSATGEGEDSVDSEYDFVASTGNEVATVNEDEYDFIRPDFDWSGLEEAEDDEETQEEIYTFVYITQNTKGKNGATTVKASSSEEAKAYFEEFAKENDLGELDWTYDEDTKTFTAREKLEDDSDDESDDSSEEKPGQDDSDKGDSDDSTEGDTDVDDTDKEGSDDSDDTTSDDSKDQKPGQDEPVKPGKAGEEQVATPVQDSKQVTGQAGSQASGQSQAPAGQVSGQQSASDKESTEDAGQTLPDTATSAWALGLLGLSSLAGGLFVHKNKEN